MSAHLNDSRQHWGLRPQAPLPTGRDFVCCLLQEPWDRAGHRKSFRIQFAPEGRPEQLKGGRVHRSGSCIDVGTVGSPALELFNKFSQYVTCPCPRAFEVKAFQVA